MISPVEDWPRGELAGEKWGKSESTITDHEPPVEKPRRSAVQRVRVAHYPPKVQ